MESVRKLLFLFFAILLLAACHKGKYTAYSVPTADSSEGSLGPASEIDNQMTSTPIVVENLPAPVSSATEARPMIQLPTPMHSSQPPKPPAEPKRGTRAAVPAESAEPRPSASQPPIQLRPQVGSSDRDAMLKKINEQLESARSRLKSIDETQVPQELRTSLNAAFDFIRKADEAVKRGEYYQGLVLAQKANTLASIIAAKP